MYRITTNYTPETSSVTININLIVGNATYIMGTKQLFADINYDESVTFGTSRLTYKSYELENFIKDIKANNGTQFYFDQSNDEDGSVDGIIYGNNNFIFTNIYGKNCLRIQMPVTDENKELIIEDLETLHTQLNKYAIDTIDDYRALGDDPEPEDKEIDEQNKKEINEEK